jgi:hypothetical protein
MRLEDAQAGDFRGYPTPKGYPSIVAPRASNAVDFSRGTGKARSTWASPRRCHTCHEDADSATIGSYNRFIERRLPVHKSGATPGVQ